MRSEAAYMRRDPNREPVEDEPGEGTPPEGYDYSITRRSDLNDFHIKLDVYYLVSVLPMLALCIAGILIFGLHTYLPGAILVLAAAAYIAAALAIRKRWRSRHPERSTDD